jgi:hypothetical protein
MDVAAGIFGLGIVATIIVGLISLVAFLFWVWMIIDCAGRTFPGDNEKTIWLLLLILVGLFTAQGWLVALIYYFAVKRKYD